MDIEADFLVNPLSYILGAVSFIGFFIVARNEFKFWLGRHLLNRRAVGVGKAACPIYEQKSGDTALSARRTSIIVGLVLMGIAFSALIYIANATVMEIEPVLQINKTFLIVFAFTMLPGALAGVAAEAWIHPPYEGQPVDLLNGLLKGMLVYVGWITVVEITQMHVLLFLCGPVITLFVYRFSPG